MGGKYEKKCINNIWFFNYLGVICQAVSPQRSVAMKMEDDTEALLNKFNEFRRAGLSAAVIISDNKKKKIRFLRSILTQFFQLNKSIENSC